MSEDPALKALLAQAQAYARRDPEAMAKVQKAYAAGHPVLRRLALAFRRADRGKTGISEATRRRHGLTAQEARVVECLVGGGTVQTCAQTLGCAESTVRSHLKAVFWKTGIRRQLHLSQLFEDVPDSDGRDD